MVAQRRNEADTSTKSSLKLQFSIAQKEIVTPHLTFLTYCYSDSYTEKYFLMMSTVYTIEYL